MDWEQQQQVLLEWIGEGEIEGEGWVIALLLLLQRNFVFQ